MAISINNEYPTKTGAPSADWPLGEPRNVTTPGDGTGTPWIANVIKDLMGFQQKALTEAGITPSGTPDTGATSQILEALRFVSPLAFKNKIINGNFDIWQRATSQTAAGYGSDDRWGNDNSGSTKTHSRQTFALGQTDVPGNPKYYSRTVVTSVAGASNYVIKYQKVENVLTLAGGKATLSFYAKADASKNIAVEIVQTFGTGGAPSADVLAIGVTTVALTTAWQKFTITVDLPSISGKTLGTNNNDYLGVNFWFDAGTNFDVRTNSLGQQSGTFDISQVQLEEGDTATAFEDRHPAIEEALCLRYYEKITQTASLVAGVCSGAMFTSGAFYGVVNLSVRKRATPAITLSAASTFRIFTNGATFTPSSVGAASQTNQTFRLNATIIGAVAGDGAFAEFDNSGTGYVAADAEL